MMRKEKNSGQKKIYILERLTFSPGLTWNVMGLSPWGIALPVLLGFKVGLSFSE